MIPAVQTARHRAVQAQVHQAAVPGVRHRPVRLHPVAAVPAAVRVQAPQAVAVLHRAAVLQVHRTDRIGPAEAESSDFPGVNWCCIRSVVVKVMTAIRTRTIPAVRMTARLQAALHRAAVAAVLHRHPHHRAVPAVAVPRPQAAALPAARHHRAAVPVRPALQVHRMTVRLQAPVIPAKTEIR